MTQPARDATIAAHECVACNRPRRALHVITGLNVGGAERMLLKLAATGTDASMVRHSVISLTAPGVVGDQLRQMGIGVESLEMRRDPAAVAALWRLRTLIQANNPDIVVGWMHHAFLAATLAMKGLSPKPRLIWNVRHSLADAGKEKMSTRMILGASARLSGAADAIVYNSRNARRQYQKIGFHDSNALVIPNGFDIEIFSPRSGARKRLEAIFAVPPDRTIIAMIARAHEMKSPEVLAEAFKGLLERKCNVHLLFVGEGMTSPQAPLVRVLTAMPQGRVTLSEHRGDLAEWFAGVDICALSSSWGEAFPNVLGEAMASGVPCVATDVGDCADIVGDTGRIAPPGDTVAFGAALLELTLMSQEDRKSLGFLGRARVIERYAIEKIRADYAALYERVAADGPAPLASAPARGTAAT